MRLQLGGRRRGSLHELDSPSIVLSLKLSCGVGRSRGVGVAHGQNHCNDQKYRN
jgi:hypothetical protein